MSDKFILSCGSTVDLPYDYVASRGISVIFYSYSIGDEEFEEDMMRTPGAVEAMYDTLMHSDVKPTTSQINEAAYEAYFEPLVKQGDVLHIAFGSGMSGSVNNAMRAAETLMEKYPDRKVIVLDSYCSSSGYGMLVDYAADLRDQGKSLDEVAEWVRAHAKCIHHQFFTDDLTFFRRSGRMSGATATLASILGICPILRINNAGRITAYDKVRGKKKALQYTVQRMIDHAEGGLDYAGKCFVCHSLNMADAEVLRDKVAATFPNVKAGDIRICDIGGVIGTHCGPGTVALFFLGDEREE